MNQVRNNMINKSVKKKVVKSVNVQPETTTNYSMLTLSKELSRYSEVDHSKNLKQWIIQFINKHNLSISIDSLKEVKDCYFQTIGIVCKLLNEGNVLPEKYSVSFIEQKLQYIINNTVKEEVVAKEEKKVPYKKDSYEVIAESLFSVIDLQINQFLKNKETITVPSVVMSSYKKELDILYSFAGKQWEEEVNYLSISDDSEKENYTFYNEAYSNFTSEQKEQLKNFYTTILQKIKKAKYHGFETNLVVVKQPKVNKVLTPVKTAKQAIIAKKKEIFSKEKQLKTLVFMPSYESLVSFNPKEIFAAKEIYILDTKYNKITYLVVEKNQKFEIKGRSIINFDEVESGSKRIPKKVYSSLIISAKNNVSSIVMKKIFNSINNDKTEFAGRVSEHMILLKNY